jgi:hypothetical protein
MTTLAELERKARFGHRKIIYWQKDGEIHHCNFNKDGIKKAILSVGINGRWYWLDGSGCSHIVKNFRFGIHLWRCAA